MRLFAFAVGLVVAGPALAFDVSALPVGSTARWHCENGDTKVQYLGPDKGGFRLAFTRDSSKGAPLSMTWWVTRGGEMTLATGPKINQRFRPNDCELTPGTCRYVETRIDGASRKMIRVTKVSGETWHYSLYHDRVAAASLVESGQFTVDRYGLFLSHDYIYDGKSAWCRRLK